MIGLVDCWQLKRAWASCGATLWSGESKSTMYICAAGSRSPCRQLIAVFTHCCRNSSEQHGLCVHIHTLHSITTCNDAFLHTPKGYTQFICLVHVLVLA